MDPKNTVRTAWQPYLVAVVLIAAAAALRLWPLQALGVRLAWVTFYPAVVGAALYGGFFPGLLGTFLSCFTLLYLWPVLGGQPFIRDSADWLGLAVFTVTCVMISFICEAARRSNTRAKEAREQLETANIKLREEIDERKRAEDERDRFFNLSLDLLCIAGFDGYFKQVNPAWEKTLGWTSAELLSKPYLEFIHPDDRHVTASEAGKNEEGERSIAFENRYRCKDGSYRWLSWMAMPLKEQTLIYATARDVTESKQAEERFQIVVESAPYAILMVNQRGGIVLVNSQAESVFGYTREELMGQSTEMLVPGQYREKHPEDREGFFRDPRARAMGAGRDLFGLRKDGREIPIEIGLSPLATPDGPCVLAAVIDITERKHAEEAIKQLNARLELINKELEAFSYSVAHDLRAPLRTIDGFSQALLEDYSEKLGADGQDSLRRVRAASQRMALLIDDMLNLSRVTRAEMRHEQVNLSSMAQTITEELRKTLPERDATFVIAPGLIAQGDSRLLRVALENLLANAWKFTGKKPRARIEFGMMEQEGKPVYFVRDDGAGFDMTYSEKLFGVFQRLHAMTEFPGTGVGLATVQRIVHRHGGRIWAEGAVDKGATFYFTL